MFAYYVSNAIFQIPSFIYIARVLGGTVFTDGQDSFKILNEYYSDVKSEYYPTIQELRARMEDLRPEAVIQPDYTKHVLKLRFKTVHVQVFHGSSDKAYGLRRDIRGYDFLLLPGERSLKTMAKAGILKPGHYSLIGYPKADRVFQGKLIRNDAIRALNLVPDRPTILYAPTWRDGRQDSSLPKFGLEVMADAPEKYNLIVKLHPNTRKYDRRNYDLLTRLAEGKPYIKFLGYDHDVIPIMAAADLLLCDISSVSHEFLCFDRPLVFLDPRVLPVRKSKTWVWCSGHVVKQRGKVWETVAEALANPGKYTKERSEARDSIYFKSDGNAAERAAEAIRNFLAKGTGSEV